MIRAIKPFWSRAKNKSEPSFGSIPQPTAKTNSVRYFFVVILKVEGDLKDVSINHPSAESRRSKYPSQDMHASFLNAMSHEAFNHVGDTE